MSEWPLVRLDRLCELRPQKAEARARLKPTDRVSFVPMNDLPTDAMWLDANEVQQLSDVQGSYTYFADRDVLLAKITPCFENGKLGIARNLVNGVGFGSSEFFVLRPSEKLLPEYLYYFLVRQDFRDSGAAVMTGAVGHRRVPKEFIEGTLLPLPSLAEQGRIVGILGEAFAGIAIAVENAKRNLSHASACFQSVLDVSFEELAGVATPIPLRDALAEQPRNGWSPPANGHSETGTPVLTLSAVTGHQFRPEKVKYTSATTDPERHYWLRNGDLLISRSNTPQLVGHVAIVGGISEPTLYPDLIMRMRPKPEVADVAFLWFQLRTDKLRHEIAARAHGANPTMVKLAKIDVQTLPVVMPPIEVQKAVAVKLYAMEAKTAQLARIYNDKLHLLSELKKAILQRAFSGELRGNKAIAA